MSINDIESVRSANEHDSSAPHHTSSGSNGSDASEETGSVKAPRAADAADIEPIMSGSRAQGGVFGDEGCSLADYDGEADAESVRHLREFGHLDNVVHIEYEFRPMVLQKPRIHQYLKNGKMHRSKAERPVDQFELFLDLVMVGVVHQLADASAERLSGGAIARFVLTFWGAWTIWNDYRNFVNISGMDDLPQRVYTFCIMALLLGYTSNATGIEFEPDEFHESKSALRGALGFFLVAKLIRLIFHVFYGIYLKEFFLNQMLGAGNILVASAFYLGSMFSPTVRDSAILFGVGGLFEILSPLLIGLWSRDMSKCKGEEVPYLLDTGKVKWFQIGAVATINIEHLSERNSAFYTIVLGESVASVLYNVHKIRKAAGINPFYGRAFMVLIVAFSYNWLYFTRDWNVSKTHPVRRSWFTSWVYRNVHWPLCGSLILASAGVSNLVGNENSNGDAKALQWYFGGGNAVALVCLIVLEVIPRWEVWTVSRAAVLGTRLFFRAGCAAICATIPLADGLNDLQFVGIYASVFVFLMFEELVGKLVLMKEGERLNEEKRRMKTRPIAPTSVAPGSTGSRKVSEKLGQDCPVKPQISPVSQVTQA